MRKRNLGLLGVTVLFLCALVASAVAQPFPTNLVVRPNQYGSLTLAWDKSPDTNVVGYVVYTGIAPGVYNVKAETTNTTAGVSNLAAGFTYYFAVTARPLAGNESEFSNEVTWTITKPPAPTLRTLGLSAVLKSAESPAGPWRVEHRWEEQRILADEARRFYRVELVMR